MGPHKLKDDLYTHGGFVSIAGLKLNGVNNFLYNSVKKIRI